MTELKSCSSEFFPELCGVNITVDPQSRTGSDDDRVLIIAQIGAGASASAGQVLMASAANVDDLFGPASMASRMVREFAESCPTAELSVLTVANNLTASQTTVEFTVLQPPVTPCQGLVYLWVNGQVYQVPFNREFDDETDIASRFQAVIAATDLSLSVTAALGVLTIETMGTGAIGGFLDVRSSYDVRPDLVTGCGVTSVITNVTVAADLPDISAIDLLEDGYEFVANPFTDSVSSAMVADYACRQWAGGANSRVYGVFYGLSADAAIFGTQSNNALLSYMAVNGSLTPPYLETADYACLMYGRLNCASDSVAASTNGLGMPSLLAPERADRYTSAEKAMLVENGMGYFDVNRVNAVSIGRAVTTFTTRDNGSLDVSLRDVNAPAIIACISKFMRDEITARFTGYSFRTDGVTPNGITNVATVAGIRNFITSLGSTLSNRNLIQDLQGFVQSVQITVGDDGCIGITIDPTLVSSFCCMNVTLRTIS